MAKRRRRSNKRFYSGEPDGFHPGDDIGNRVKKSRASRVPDDIGNRKSAEETKKAPADDFGNRVESAPTHQVSGALEDLDPRRRRRKGPPPVRIGKYIVGGVNPLVAGNTARALKAYEDGQQKRAGGPKEKSARRRGGRAEPREAKDNTERYFDFTGDERFARALKSNPEQKRKEAEEAVKQIATHTCPEAKVDAHLIEDGEHPKLLVLIGDEAEEPIFHLGGGALGSLNYLVNKIVNRFPDDRIRLTILPSSSERRFRDALSAHQKTRVALAEAAEKAREQLGPASDDSTDRVSLGAFQLPRAGSDAE